MFDLDQHVQSWRQSAAGALGNQEAVLDEFDRLAAAGQPAAAAWDLAVRQLGNPQELAGEFAKVRNRFWVPAWAAAGVLVVCSAFSCVALPAHTNSTFSYPLLAAHVMTTTAGYMAVFTIGIVGMLAALTRAVRGWSDAQDAAFREGGKWFTLFAAFGTALAVVLGATWSHSAWGRWWNGDPREIGAACVLAWACLLFECFRRRLVPPQARLVVCVLGAIVAATAWFGPLLMGGLHSYGREPELIGRFLGGFLLSQILIVYLSLLPPGALRPARFHISAK